MSKGSSRRPKSVTEEELEKRWGLAFGAPRKDAGRATVPADFPEDWDWPEGDHPWQQEWLCPHGIGHGAELHSCDGCCSHPSFPLHKKGS